MIKNKTTVDPGMRDGYIPAPYVLEEGENINDLYLEPVLFKNENGPTIGVTTCGVIVKDGLYFKDMDNTGKLDPYKDWRLSSEERAKDMVKHLRLDQQAGLVINVLWNNPMVPTRAEMKDENGNYIPEKIFHHYDPDEPIPPQILPGVNMVCTDKDVLEGKITAGVYRGDLMMEAATSAIYNNFATQMLEYEACQGGAAIPYTLHTNPINIGYPDSLGIGAACLGDGNFDMMEKAAAAERKMNRAAGIYVIYGPQVDVSTDPRWPRISGTYGERTDINTGIIKALVRGYQAGEDGLNEESVVITVKHFPGDGPSENGFEPHLPIGQWRLYPTEGSMEKYHLPPFQAAFDMKASAIMPDYSRITTDGRSKPQTYRGKTTSTEAVPSCYSKELITDLARGEMGFDGYVNSDSGVTTLQIYGVENLSLPERFAKIISAGTDVIGCNADSDCIVEAVEKGYLPKEDLDRASYNRLLSMFRMKRVDNPYLDPDHADKVREDNLDDARKAAYEANKKAVVLAKNHESVLPMKQGAKVYVECFHGVDNNAAFAKAMGMSAGGESQNDVMRKRLSALFEKYGYVVVDAPEEADLAYLHVWPVSNGTPFSQFAMPEIDLVEDKMCEMREAGKSQKKTGEMVAITTLKDVARIPEISDTVHAHGGKVIATCVVTNPWLLGNLEPYVDALTFQYTVSEKAMDNALHAQMEVLSGKYAPTGKMSLTMVSGPEVIAIHEEEIDGVVREICASPNDVPGYDKDQYIDPEVLAKVPGGSYAYRDADGNYYRSGFGLSYSKKA